MADRCAGVSPALPSKGTTKGKEEWQAKGKMSLSLASLQLAEQWDLSMNKGMQKQPSQNRSVGWGVDIFCWMVTKSFCWISYSGFITQTWHFAFPLYPKALCQQVLVSNKATRCVTASSARGLSATFGHLFGHLSAFSGSVWMQTPSPPSPSHYVNEPANDPISRSCSVSNWQLKGSTFSGPGNHSGGICVTAFPRQYGSAYSTNSLSPPLTQQLYLCGSSVAKIFTSPPLLYFQQRKEKYRQNFCRWTS